jgi:hypothetical protein
MALKPVVTQTSNVVQASTGNATGAGAKSGSISITNTFNTVINFFAHLVS